MAKVKQTEQINPQLAPLVRALKGLREDPKNARRHSKRSVESIKRSLQEYGQQKPIVLLADGTVLAGNGTLRAAQQLGWKSIAAVTFDSAEEAKAKGYAISDNRTSELSAWDEGGLAGTVEDLITLVGDDFDPLSIGFTEDEIASTLGIGVSADDLPDIEPTKRKATAAEDDEIEDEADDEGGEQEREPAEKPDPSLVELTFTLSKSDAKTIRKALKQAGRDEDAEGDAAQLLVLALAYLSAQEG